MRLFQGIKKRILAFRRPVWGALLGLGYVILDEMIIPRLLFNNPSPATDLIHSMVYYILPIVCGMLIGFGVNFLETQNRLNKQLSFRNAHLQRNLLVSMLISQFLHEIRNPIHSLSAALEDGVKGMGKDREETVKRALSRFEEVTQRYKNWESSIDKIDPRAPVLLKPWLGDFVRDHLGEDLEGLGVIYEENVEPLRIFFHPALLEQALVSVVANAFDVLEEGALGGKLRIAARLTAPSGERNVELQIINSGGVFPQEVLKAQGRAPVLTRRGSGFGLLLTRKLLEYARGDLRLENIKEMACVTLIFSGERA